MFYRGEPLNYGGSGVPWPRTQDLEPVFRITSALFLGDTSLLNNGDRVGAKPRFFEVEGLQALDIDWPKEFEFGSIQFSNLSA